METKVTPRVFPIVPGGSHYSPWHTVGPRGNSLAISRGVPREFPCYVPWDPVGPPHTSYWIIIPSEDEGFLKYRYLRPWVAVGIPPGKK